MSEQAIEKGKMSGIPELVTHSSENKPSTALATKNVTSRPIKSSRVWSISLVYAPIHF